MPEYRDKVHGVRISLPEGHDVVLGSEWAEVGKADEKPAPRTRKKSTGDE